VDSCKKELLEDEPHLSKDIAGGMEMACDGAINPMAVSQGLAYGALKLGTKIQTQPTRGYGLSSNSTRRLADRAAWVFRGS